MLTIGALLGMAAHIEGKASMILDMSGLAQKGGAVLSHVRLSEHAADVTCSRIVTGTADLVIAADEVVAAAKETMTLCESGRTFGVINTHLIPIADFILNRDFNFQARKVNHVLETALRKDSSFFDFTKPAEVLLGDSIATNMMMMGFAYQKGMLPLSAKAIEQAIEVNGVAIKMNTQAFRLGRLAAADPARIVAMMKGQDDTAAVKTLDEMSLDEIIAHRSALLTDYQNAALAERYRGAGDKSAQRRARRRLWRSAAARGRDQLRKTARLQGRVRSGAALYRRPLRKAAARPVRGRLQVQFQSRAANARRRQRRTGPSAQAQLWRLDDARVPLLAKMKGLRGTAFDIFGHSADRKLERDLIAAYEKDVDTVLGLLSPVTLDTAIELLSIPDRIRGYGPVKEKAVRDARARHAQLAADLVSPPPAPRQIAAE